MGSHPEDVICPDPVDDQKVIIVATDHKTSRTAMHALL